MPSATTAAMPPLLYAFLVSLICSAALVPLCRVLARSVGVVARPRDDRWHRDVIPLLGGVAIALALLLGALITGVAQEFAVPLTLALLMFAVGLVDDVVTLKPTTKLIAQIALAAALVYFGYRLQWLESRLLDNILTVVWVVGLTNAFNLLDNMDGLCAGIAVVVGVMLLMGFYTGATRDIAGDQIVFLALLVGATTGFLLYNYPPASIFMGDSGSLLLGFTLAALTLSPEGVRGSRADVVSAIAGPVFVLLVPIFDTTLVTVSRLLSGRSPATGGRDHSSHRLVALGFSERSAVFVLWLLALVGGSVGLLLRLVSAGESLLVGGLFLVAVCLFAVYLARIRVYEEIDPSGARARGVTPLAGEFLYKRRVAEVVLDFWLVVAAYYAAHRLRFEDPEEFLTYAERFFESLPVVLGVQLVSFFVAGVYRGVWRHFGLVDSVTVAIGIGLGTLTTQVVVWYAYDYASYSKSVFVIYMVLLGMLVIASRASFRLMDEFMLRRRRGGRRAVIYGAGERAGVALRQLQNHEAGGLRILGFIDDNPSLTRTSVHGHPVLGGWDVLEQMISTKQLDTVILNTPALEPARMVTLLALCDASDVPLLGLHITLEQVVSTAPVSPTALTPP